MCVQEWLSFISCGVCVSFILNMSKKFKACRLSRLIAFLLHWPITFLLHPEWALLHVEYMARKLLYGKDIYHLAEESTCCITWVGVIIESLELQAFKMATSKICVRGCRVKNPVPSTNLELPPSPLFFQFKTKTEHCFLHLGPNPPNPYVNHSRGLETYCVFCFFFAFLLSFSLHIVNTKGQNTACTDRVCVVKVITGIG